MFTIALIGPDGAGKTTLARSLEQSFPLPVKYLYMGMNLQASNHLLPTTQLVRCVRRALGKGRDQGGPPDPQRAARRPKGLVRRGLRSVKSGLGLMNRLAEEWHRQWIAWRHCKRGRIVIFDRHFYADYYAHDIAGQSQARSLAQRIHGYVLARAYPRPDLVICLDAPAEVLFARKAEGTIELLERRRQEYLRLGEMGGPFVLVDASRPQAEVARDVIRHILDFYQAKTGRRIEWPVAEGESPERSAPLAEVHR